MSGEGGNSLALNRGMPSTMVQQGAGILYKIPGSQSRMKYILVVKVWQVGKLEASEQQGSYTANLTVLTEWLTTGTETLREKRVCGWSSTTWGWQRPPLYHKTKQNNLIHSALSNLVKFIFCNYILNISILTAISSYDPFILWPIHPLKHSSSDKFIPWQIHHLTIHPLTNSSSDTFIL